MSGRKRPAPLSVRLSDDERAILEARAGRIGVSTYVKSVLFGSNPVVAGLVRQPRMDDQMLAQLVGRLGRSELASSLLTIARQAELGTLYCDDTLRQQLRDTCREIFAIRSLLVDALARPIRARDAFNQASGSDP